MILLLLLAAASRQQEGRSYERCLFDQAVSTNKKKPMIQALWYARRTAGGDEDCEMAAAKVKRLTFAGVC
jgi:hypothetical protein